jgi:hypothetical protein
LKVSIPFKTWHAYWEFERAVRHQARFLLTEDCKQFLEAVAVSAVDRIKPIPVRKALWRARIGYDLLEIDDQVEEPIPRKTEDMKPKRFGAIEGRANPKGIPYLYTASTPDTAVAEVRPLLGDYVTVARMGLRRELKIVDCSAGMDEQIHVWFTEPDPAERAKVVWQYIAQAFSRPAKADPGEAEYVPTQILAEHFRQLGYDGIGYKSKLGSGFNVAIFDMDLLDVMDRRLHEVTAVRYESKQCWPEEGR